MPDPSPLYPQYQPPKPLDPFQAIGALGSVLQFQRNKMQLDADKAIGDEYRNALTPNGVDFEKFYTGVKSNPNAAFGLRGATTDALSQQTTQFNNLAAQNHALFDFIGSKLNQPGYNKNQMFHDIVTFGRAHNMPGGVLAPWAIHAPEGGKQFQDYVGGMVNAARGAGASAETVPVTNPDGSITNVPKGALVHAGGTAGAFPGSPALGSGESAGDYQAGNRRAANFKNDIFPLEKALDLAKKLGPGGMAPGSKGRQEFESYVYGLAPSLLPAGVQDKIKNYAELEKYLVQNTQQRAQGLGPHTNEGLAVATTGSPNVHINDLAGVDLIKAQIMLRRMEHAQHFEAAKAGPVNYSAVKGGIAAAQEPSAYGIDMMEPDRLEKLKKTLKGPARDRFNASLRSAIESGTVVKP